MDSNQTRLQLLLGRDDWARCTTDTGAPMFDGGEGNSGLFGWDATRSELTLGTRINVFQSSAGNRVQTMDQRRGAATDRFGNIYWIADSQSEILVRSAGTYSSDHFWSSTDETQLRSNISGSFGNLSQVAPPQPLLFSGLTVTSEHYLVVGTLEPAGLVIFDLFRGGPPRRVHWPTSIPFSPFEFAPALGGGVWILDRDNQRLWELDRTFAVLRDNQGDIELRGRAANLFKPLDSQAQPPREPRTFPTGISLDGGSPPLEIDAVSMTVLPDNSLLLLASDPASRFSLIYRMYNGTQVGDPVSLDCLLPFLEPEDQADFKLLGFDLAFIANEQTPTGTRVNTLYVVGQNGDQTWAFTTDYSTDQISLTPLAEYFPMRLFGGRGVIAGPTQVFYDSQNTWVPLVIQRRPRYLEDATLVTFTMDGKQPDCVWDRLMLDASIPTETLVTIYSRASNDPNLLQAQSWAREPSPYLRGDGTELPWTPMMPGDGTWELLFQNATGQYLQLKLELTGNRQSTPRIRALRVHYPRFSYLEHYLPGVYREDDRSASFLDRLLSNFAGFYTSIEDRIATVQALLDPGSAPSDALDWLANWFGVALDPSWSEAKRRLFISNATTFFEARGTVPGLTMALRLTLEDCADDSIFSDPTSQASVRVVEQYKKRWLPPGLLQGATADVVVPSQVQAALWTPAFGPDELNQRYAASLHIPGTAYPTYLAPSDPLYSEWNAFSMTNLGLVPIQADTSSNLWVTFLQGRYRTITDLNNAYATSYADFTQVGFPSQLPRRSQPLWDWYQFQGILLVDAAAHQFTIFLPMVAADAQSIATQQAKVELVKRVIDLEKPAHTSYQIQFYWAFFRLGDARLGQDSVLDYGSRAPQLLLPALIGNTYLGSSYIVQQPPRRPIFKQGSC